MNKYLCLRIKVASKSGLPDRTKNSKKNVGVSKSWYNLNV